MLSSRIVIIATNCSTIYRTPCAAVAPRWYASFYNGRRLPIFLAVYTTVQLFTDEHARLKRNAEEFAVGTSGIIGWWLSSRMLRPLTPVGGWSSLASFALGFQSLFIGIYGFPPWKIRVYFTTICIRSD